MLKILSLFGKAKVPAVTTILVVTVVQLLVLIEPAAKSLVCSPVLGG